jgi:diaminopimelate epimerase
MTLNFVKYQGTGNDFVLVDNRTGAWQAYLAMQVPQQFATEKDLVAHLCHRQFGVGADGLMLLQNKEGFDFEMVYFNSDGGLSTMCGNGGRCIAAWAFALSLGDDTLLFWAPDGVHEASKTEDNKGIALTMNPVSAIAVKGDGCWELNTGSPHYVQFQTTDLQELPLIEWARSIRYSDAYMPAGINVNAVRVIGNNHIAMRTYERGVENETLSCGTGVTAAAIAYINSLGLNPTQPTNHHVHVDTAGGQLQVRFAAQNDQFSDIQLIGPATFVFRGQL